MLLLMTSERYLVKTMSNMSAQEMTEQLIEQVVTTKSNEEFLARMQYFFKNK